MEPNVDPQAEARIIAKERMRLLAIAYYISGAIGAVMVSLLIFHLIFFTTFSFMSSSMIAPPPSKGLVIGPDPTPNPLKLNSQPAADLEQFPQTIFRIFAAIIAVIILIGWTLGGLTIYAGRCLATRKHKPLIYTMAAVNCLFLPFGTLLGVVTFILLGSSAAQQLFTERLAPPAPAPSV